MPSCLKTSPPSSPRRAISAVAFLWRVLNSPALKCAMVPRSALPMEYLLRLLGRLRRTHAAAPRRRLLEAARLQLAGRLQHRGRHRADMRVDALQVAEHVGMQWAGLDALGPAFAQPRKMPLGGGALDLA